ncbi:MAG: CotH kinase family protein [Bacteroidetes bacterium]|nr:CotH kinase family protein [Bacteroidota bacterium]
MKKLLFILSIISTLCEAQITAGDNLFNVTQIHTININFPQSNYWTLLVNNKAYDDANDSSSYIPAQVIIDGITTLDSVGIQFKGNSSYYGYPGNKKPFTLSFDEYKNNQKYDSLSSINLNNCYQDPSFIREKLFLDFLNSKGLNAPRSNFAKLYINGVYSGFYQLGERINKTFCKDRFGNKGGNLFKGDKGTTACADLKYHGSISSYTNCYTLKTNTTANNWSDLINLTKQINTTTTTQFKDSVDKALDANSFIGSWAACNMFVDFDAYAFRFVHNYYIYHNTATDKFEWITWDASTVFGMDVPGTVASIESKSILYIEPSATDRPLANRMLNDVAYKNQYITFVCDFLNTFNPSVLNPKIDSLYNLIKADVYADPLKMFNNTQFDNNINSNITVGSTTYPGLKSFIQNRSTNIQNELVTLGYNCSVILGINDSKQNNIDLMIYPNPTKGSFSIEYSLLKNMDVNIVVTDVLGKEIYTENSKAQSVGLHKQEINFELETGIYNVSIKTADVLTNKKIVISK